VPATARGREPASRDVTRRGRTRLVRSESGWGARTVGARAEARKNRGDDDWSVSGEALDRAPHAGGVVERRDRVRRLAHGAVASRTTDVLVGCRRDADAQRDRAQQDGGPESAGRSDPAATRHDGPESRLSPTLRQRAPLRDSHAPMKQNKPISNCTNTEPVPLLWMRRSARASSAAKATRTRPVRRSSRSLVATQRSRW
jgi:hypothetical protein